MKAWWRRFRPRILGPLVYWLVRLLGSTWKVHAIGYEPYENLPGGIVFAGWHGRTAPAAIFFRNKGFYTIISASNDGRIQDRIFRGFGFKTLRGSTGRGGVKAAAASIRVLRAGAKMAFTPDGPRGPSGIVQPGILLLARRAGVPMVPVGVSADRRWLVRSWDRYMVPKPFARAVLVFGEPFTLSESSGEAETEAVRQAFERRMHELEREADRAMGHEPAQP